MKQDYLFILSEIILLYYNLVIDMIFLKHFYFEEYQKYLTTTPIERNEDEYSTDK